LETGSVLVRFAGGNFVGVGKKEENLKAREANCSEKNGGAFLNALLSTSRIRTIHTTVTIAEGGAEPEMKRNLEGKKKRTRTFCVCSGKKGRRKRGQQMLLFSRPTG